MTSRFLKSVARTAARTDTKLPWTRGARRRAFIARRAAPAPVRKSA